MKSYSKDLRIRIIEYIETGHSQAESCKIYKIGKSTVSRWWQRWKKAKEQEARKRGGSQGKINLGKLEEYIEKNSNASLKEIGKEFGVSGTAVGYRLNELGYSYKKKRIAMWKLRKKGESNIGRKLAR